MNMSVGSFESQFGRTIKFLSGYRAKYTGQINAARSALQYRSEEIARPASFYSFAKDAFEYAMMIEELEQSGVQLKNVLALDIGGMEATTSRLLKAEGIAAEAHCVDIHDYSQQLTTEQFYRFLTRLRVSSLIAPWSVRFNFQEHFDYSVTRRSRFHNIRNTAGTATGLDEYFSCGFLEMREEVKYGLVSALLCLPYFPLKEFYQKLSAVIAKGGYFFFLSDYWWSHNNSTGLIGHFPWCAQRLTEADFFRYFEREHPEDLEVARQRYRYYHNNEEHPTLSDHIKVAESHGFRLLACRRHIAREHDGERNLVTPEELENVINIADVLEDIHAFREDVCAADLRTSFVSAIFVRN